MDHIRDYNNVYEMLRTTIDACPNEAAYRWVGEDRSLVSLTWRESHEELRRAARSLMALGVVKGDRIAIQSFTCYRWVLVDLAALAIGAVTTGIFHSNLADDCAYVINHSGSKLLFVEDRVQLDKMLGVRASIPGVEKVVMFGGERPAGTADWVLTFDEFMALGESVDDARVDQAARAVAPGDLAAIVYTSGTTGVPRGVMLTHDNFIFSAQSVAHCVPVRKNDETLLFLPLAHVFARVGVFASNAKGVALTFSRGIDKILEDLLIVRPHWFASVPRIFDKVYTRVTSKAEEKGGIALAIFRWGLGVGYRVSERQIAKKWISPYLALRYAIVKALLFSKLHAALGGRIRFMVCGAAPLNPDVAKFFHAAGLPILDGYGMTENTAFTNVTALDRQRFGSVGFPAPGVEQRIADDGEILYRGRNVMAGYYRMPQETAEALDAEGWLHTGDTGFVDADGFLFIAGRKKDIIITSGGKNIAPLPVESALTNSKYVNQACLVGDGRQYLTALVTLDPDNIRDFATRQGIVFTTIDELYGNEKVHQLMDSIIAGINKNLASYMTVKKYTLVPEFTIENGMMTPTLKLKKKLILDRYAKEIEAMYA